MKNIVLFGPPGAGKGTQSKKIIDKYNLIHLSTGDLFRSEIADETELGLRAKEYMNAGKLVPDEVVVGMVENKVKANLSSGGFVFDGFPRTIAQAGELDKILDKYNLIISKCIALDVDEKEIVTRILERGKTSNRPDDKNEELIKIRVQEYFSKTAPVADYYDKQGKFAKIAGVGTVEEIFENLCNEMDKV